MHSHLNLFVVRLEKASMIFMKNIITSVKEKIFIFIKVSNKAGFLIRLFICTNIDD